MKVDQLIENVETHLHDLEVNGVADLKDTEDHLKQILTLLYNHLHEYKLYKELMG